MADAKVVDEQRFEFRQARGKLEKLKYLHFYLIKLLMHQVGRSSFLCSTDDDCNFDNFLLVAPQILWQPN